MASSDDTQDLLPRPRGRPVSMKKRRSMLEAAIAEFQAHGYAGASMDAIAASANVSKRTLYNHFSSKEALFRSLADEMGRRISAFSRIEYDPRAPLRDQLLDYARKSVDLIHDPELQSLVRALLREQMYDPDLVAEALVDYWRDEYGFSPWVRAALEDGRLTVQSPERAAHTFAALIKGIGVWPVVFRRSPPEGDELEAALQEAVDMFLSYHGV